MANNKGQLFNILENILKTVTEINTLTQNQETVILHGADKEMFSQLVKNKQEMIAKLNKLEDEFQEIYLHIKEEITSKEDVRRLQELVGKIVDTKAMIANSEERNRRLWASKDGPKINVEPVRQPSSYVAKQYIKWGQSPSNSE